MAEADEAESRTAASARSGNPSSTWLNTLTRASGSSSSEGGKVRVLRGAARCRDAVPSDGAVSCVGVRKLTPVTGVLKGYDQLMNLVMDEVVETYESASLTYSASKLTSDDAMPPRNLGLVVLRGPNVVLISPTDGSAGE